MYRIWPDRIAVRAIRANRRKPCKKNLGKKVDLNNSPQLTPSAHYIQAAATGLQFPADSGRPAEADMQDRKILLDRNM
jgi:hypothetical protein